MQLSQVDPWNGCEVCRRQAELGVMPCHNWTHELRIRWNDKVPAWTYGTDLKKHEPPEPSAIGMSSTAIGLAVVAPALALLADKPRKGLDDEIRSGSLESYYYAGRLAGGKYRPSTVKEATDAK